MVPGFPVQCSRVIGAEDQKMRVYPLLAAPVLRIPDSYGEATRDQKFEDDKDYRPSNLLNFSKIEI
jgi:hypothetical protein